MKTTLHQNIVYLRLESPVRHERVKWPDKFFAPSKNLTEYYGVIYRVGWKTFISRDSLCGENDGKILRRLELHAEVNFSSCDYVMFNRLFAGLGDVVFPVTPTIYLVSVDGFKVCTPMCFNVCF